MFYIITFPNIVDTPVIPLFLSPYLMDFCISTILLMPIFKPPALSLVSLYSRLLSFFFSFLICSTPMHASFSRQQLLILLLQTFTASSFYPLSQSLPWSSISLLLIMACAVCPSVSFFCYVLVEMVILSVLFSIKCPV